MFQRIGASAYKKDLSNTLALCEALGNPQDKLKCIHIAGTNGKGTSSHIVAYGLQKQGYKVGLYTSPHYKDFRERIKINGQFCSRNYILDFVNTHIEIIKKIQPSFFEITVAMAFDYFAKKKVDYAVIEVGLGGRLDSTNIITPLLSVITNISFDHMDLLGSTLPEIASEKAGIIKKNIPVLIGEKQKSVNAVFVAKAKEMNAKLSYAQSICKIETNKKSAASRNITLSLNDQALAIKTNLLAPYHDANMITAFSALHHLSKEIKIDFKKITKDFINFCDEIKYMGRWQVIQQKPLIIFDSAHNEAGIDFAMTTLKSQYDTKNIHFVLGFVKDKDLEKVLKKFPKESHYYFAKANIPRGLDAAILKEKASSFELHGSDYKSVKSAYSTARKTAKKGDVIYVGGSIFVVAEVL